MIVQRSIADLLADSLAELLETKDIGKISVQEIARNCGLSARTFYNHFPDKHALVQYLYGRLIETCWYDGERFCGLTEFLSHLTVHISTDHHAFFLHTFSYYGQNDIRQAIEEKGVHDLNRLLERLGHGDVINEQTNKLLTFYMNGLTYTLEKELRLPNAGMEVWQTRSREAVAYLPAPVGEYLLEIPKGDPTE